MMIPNGLTRDDLSSMPQFLPLVSKPISNQYLTIIRWILFEYQLVIGAISFCPSGESWTDILLGTHWSTIGLISV